MRADQTFRPLPVVGVGLGVGEFGVGVPVGPDVAVGEAAGLCVGRIVPVTVGTGVGVAVGGGVFVKVGVAVIGVAPNPEVGVGEPAGVAVGVMAMMVGVVETGGVGLGVTVGVAVGTTGSVGDLLSQEPTEKDCSGREDTGQEAGFTQEAFLIEGDRSRRTPYSRHQTQGAPVICLRGGLLSRRLGLKAFEKPEKERRKAP